jgi:hypothetical protein
MHLAFFLLHINVIFFRKKKYIYTFLAIQIFFPGKTSSLKNISLHLAKKGCQKLFSKTTF